MQLLLLVDLNLRTFDLEADSTLLFNGLTRRTQRRAEELADDFLDGLSLKLLKMLSNVQRRFNLCSDILDQKFPCRLGLFVVGRTIGVTQPNICPNSGVHFTGWRLIASNP